MRMPITKIMIPIDGSKNSLAALQAAVGLAKDYYAELVIVNVLVTHSLPVSLAEISVGPSTAAFYEEEEKKSARMLDEALSFARKQGVRAGVQLLYKDVSIVDTIVTEASDQKVDLIIIGSRGLGGFKRMLMGSVSTGVVIHSKCPVLVIK